MQGSADGLRIGVQQEFVGIESMPVFRIVGTVNPVAIELAGLKVGDVNMPNQVGGLRQLDNPARVAGIRRAEQAQLNLFRILREEREVDPLAIPRSPQGIGFAGMNRGHGVGEGLE